MIITLKDMKKIIKTVELKPLVYIETTIPSFHDTYRKETEMLAMRNWTRQWWEHRRKYYELVTGPSVIEELERGKYGNQKEALKLIEDVRILEVTEEIVYIVDSYIRHSLMPRDVQGDALHLALASSYGCQYLLTWNCAHLANANKYEHIRHVNSLLGLSVPILATPCELLNGGEE